MSKKFTVITSIIIAVIGSIITFYATNLVLSDVSNMFYMTVTKDVISSLPALFMAINFTLATLFVIRMYRYPKIKKALINLYTILLAVFSLFGLIFSILTGTMIYHNYVAPYPFFGYSIIHTVLFVVLIVGAIYINIFVRKNMEDDKERRPRKVKYVIYTTFLSLLIFFAYNRFGSFLCAFIYAHFRTLYFTFPFYLSLLLPIGLLLHVFLYFFDVYKGHENRGIVVPAVIFGLNIILFACIAIIGSNNTQFISAISPALPIERLLTKPIDIILQFILLFLLSGFYLFYGIKTKVEILRAKKQ